MANTVALSVTVNAGAATGTLVTLNTLIAGMGPTAQQASNQATQALNNVNSSVQGLQNSLNNLQRAAALLGLGRLIKDLVMAGDAMMRVQRALSQAPGGAAAVKQLEAAADRVGLVNTELEKNANQLRNAGMGMKQAAQTAEALAVATKLAGNGQEGLNRSITVMANLYAKGFATGREIFTGFVQSGLVAGPILEKALGMSINKLRENLRNINIDVFARLLVDVAKLQDMGKDPSGANDFLGWINRVKTAFNQAGTAFNEAFGPGIVLLLKIIRDLIHDMTDWFMVLKRLPEPIRDLIPTVVALTVALYGVLRVVKLIQEAKILTTVLEAATGNKIAQALVMIGIGYKVAEYLDPRKKAEAGPLGVDEAEKKRIQQEIKDLQGQLLNVDEKKQERAEKYAENLLSEAQKRYALAGKESIEALTFAYQEHFRKVAGFAHAAALVRKALEFDIAAEVRKHTEKVTEEILKVERERAVIRRKIAINIQTTEPDETVAGKSLYAFIEARERITQVQEQSAQQIADIWRKARPQIEDAMRAGFIGEAEKYFEDYTRERIELEKKATDLTTEYWTEANKEAIKALRAYEKEQRAADLQDIITGIQQTTALRTAVIGTAVPTTPEQRIQQINAVTNSQIQGIKDVEAERLDAAKRELEIYRRLNPYNFPGQEQMAREYERERIRITNESEHQIQLNRINAWNEANRIIMEEQLKVYESIKSIADRVWDAALDRSKSFWSSLANIIKTTMLDAIKQIVTSRVAVSLAGLFGYGNFAFDRGLFGITHRPTPLGAVNPWAISTGEAVQSGVSYQAPAQGSAQRQIADDIAQISAAAQNEAVMSTRGSAHRTMEDTVAPPAAGESTLPWDLITQAATTPQAKSQGQLQTMTRGGLGSTAQGIQNLRKSFNIGQPIRTAAGTTIAWSSASATQKLASIAKSPGMGAVASMVGLPIFMAGVQRPGVLGGVMAVGGGALAGAGLAQAFGMNPVAGAMAGGGIGLMAAGWRKGGAIGLGMDVVGGAVAGAGIGAMIGGLVGGPFGFAAGAVIGAVAGAIAGGVEGVIRLFVKTQDEKIRAGIKRIYGIDIPDMAIRKQIADIANQQYGGNLNIALYSKEVQEIIRLYSLSRGIQAGLPRPMYGATMTQSAGGVQLQPVYSSGQLVQSPYSGVTTQQVASAGLYLQLNPSMALQLFSGQVVNAMQQNPATVAQSNAAALRSGSSRDAQRTALLEPMTVTR